jgi:aminopeptidase N
MGERVLRLPFIRFTSLGHEVLHNWWGNGIKIDYKSGNWAEGLTTYMADYAFSQKRDVNNAKLMRTEWLRDYAALPPSRDHSVRSFISREHAASQIIGYNKVAFIFHMLSNKVGKENFKHSIRSFWNQHKFQTAGWEDIQRTFEEESGLDLQIFFEQWLDRTGAPRLKLSNVNLDSDMISFTLSQLNLPYFLDVPIKLITKDGYKLFLVSINNRISQVNLQLSETPISISIDPEFDIFRRLGTTETSPILRDTTLSASTVVILVSLNKAMQKTAKQLVTNMMDAHPQYVKASQTSEQNGPILVIGTALEVAKFLNQNDFPAVPKALQGRGSARVWATHRQSKTGTPLPLLVIEAEDHQALHSLLRPLPHYGRRGYLIFDASTVVDSGVLPPKENPLSVQLN